ncbi:hypothetical protein [Virgibacillus ainsalahensis]
MRNPNVTTENGNDVTTFSEPSRQYSCTPHDFKVMGIEVLVNSAEQWLKIFFGKSVSTDTTAAHWQKVDGIYRNMIIIKIFIDLFCGPQYNMH